MTDIVAKLKSPAAIFYEYAADKGEFLREAADTIEALRAENARLQAQKCQIVVDDALRMFKTLSSPHAIFKPKVYPDGNQWCALYGDDLMMGVCGFGDTPAEACADFDKNWQSQTLRAARAAMEK